MAFFTRVNGVWRTVKNRYVKINGVWRKFSSEYVKINGVWRKVTLNNSELNVEEIKGFTFLYRLNRHRADKNFSDLSYNKDIPYSIEIVGSKELDKTRKGVTFTFSRNEFKEEGIISYEGILCAINKDGKLIDVSNNKNINLDIKISGSLSYELFGIKFFGYNKIFSVKDFIQHNTVENQKSKEIKNFDNVVIQPVSSRSDDYDSMTHIGIIRDSDKEGLHMVGSNGILNHTISSVTVNGVEKPFSIKIFQ